MEDILDILLDEENKDPIRLQDEKGNELVFEQVATIPHRGKLYCVLKPLTRIDGVADDEAIVFRAEEAADGTHYLTVELDELTAIDIFQEYYKLLGESKKK